MDVEKIKELKPKLLSSFRVYHLEETSSTNDDVLAMALQGAQDGLVISAKKQTKGRGRKNRTWQSKPGQSVAATLLIRPTDEEQAHLLRFTALAGLALIEVLETRYGLTAQIKWPNDVLVGGAKICGILTETLWVSDRADSLAVGIGINLGKESHLYDETLRFKATSLEEQVGYLISVDEMLEALLLAIAKLRPTMGSPEFIAKWNEKLAFVNEFVNIANEKGEIERFRLLGIQESSALLVEDAKNQQRLLYSSEIAPLSSTLPEA